MLLHFHAALSIRREVGDRYQAALPLYETIGARLGQANTLQALGDVHYMRDEYEEAVARYQAALQLGQAIGDFVSQLNSLKGLAFTAHARGDTTAGCQYAQQLLSLASQHPFFQNSPITADLRATFSSWECTNL